MNPYDLDWMRHFLEDFNRNIRCGSGGGPRQRTESRFGGGRNAGVCTKQHLFGGDWNMNLFFQYIGKFIISIDCHIFQMG